MDTRGTNYYISCLLLLLFTTNQFREIRPGASRPSGTHTAAQDLGSSRLLTCLPIEIGLRVDESVVSNH